MVDLVPDLVGLVKDAWLVTDFGFPLLSPVEYQITSLGLAQGIKNDRCKGTSLAMSDTEHVGMSIFWASKEHRRSQRTEYFIGLCSLFLLIGYYS